MTKPLYQHAPLDFTRLQMVADNEQEQVSLLRLFFRIGNECTTAMKRSCHSDEFPKWKSAAHSLKGSAANLGMSTLERLCQEAEYARETTDDQRSEILTRIIGEIEHICLN